MASDDPADVRVLVVRAADVVTALEANRRREAGAVLRVTPPFSGRMRARLHRAGYEADYGDPEPLHLEPELFVADPPAFPHPDDTEDALRAAGDYSVERHREAHGAAVDEWRETVRASLRESVTHPRVGEAEVRVLD